MHYVINGHGNEVLKFVSTSKKLVLSVLLRKEELKSTSDEGLENYFKTIFAENYQVNASNESSFFCLQQSYNLLKMNRIVSFRNNEVITFSNGENHAQKLTVGEY